MKGWEVTVSTLQGPFTQNNASTVGPQRHRKLLKKVWPGQLGESPTTSCGAIGTTARRRTGPLMCGYRMLLSAAKGNRTLKVSTIKGIKSHSVYSTKSWCFWSLANSPAAAATLAQVEAEEIYEEWVVLRTDKSK